MNIVIGDMLSFVETDENYIDLVVHGCNSRGKMNTGVAKAIRTKYPKAYTDYMNQYNNSGLKLGSVVWSDNGTVLIANAITQKNYGYDGARYASYDAIEMCFNEICDMLKGLDCSNIRLAFPLIGCDRGGLKWEIVQKIIEVSLEPVLDNLHSITLYKLN